MNELVSVWREVSGLLAVLTLSFLLMTQCEDGRHFIKSVSTKGMTVTMDGRVESKKPLNVPQAEAAVWQEWV